MKQKFSIILFIIIGFGLALTYFLTDFFQTNKTETTRSQLIIPQTTGEGGLQESSRISSITEESSISTLIELEAGETLLSLVSSDIDNDSYEDQIIAIKKYNNPFIFIIVGLYNPLKMSYERVVEYQTPISQTRTFSLSIMDLSASGQDAIVYTGFTDKNNSFLQAFHLQKQNGLALLIELVNLESDGSIFLQQEKENTNELAFGELKSPFSILVHSTETLEDRDSFNQVLTEYRWNEETRRFEEFSVETTPGTRLEAKELAKIQDGTVESFISYLNGLWLFNDTSANNELFIFFDWKNQEIIFSSGEIQEIFSWEHNTLRRNGIYITTVNSLIPNLNRKLDITLVSLDEIRIRISSDLGMVINTDTSWDGNYKKTQVQTASITKQELITQNALHSLESEGEWIFMTTSVLQVSKGNYAFISGANKEEGVYSEKTIQNETFLQFRPFSKNAFFDGFYTVTENEQGIALQPIKLSVDGRISQNGALIQLTKKGEEEKD